MRSSGPFSPSSAVVTSQASFLGSDRIQSLPTFLLPRPGRLDGDSFVSRKLEELGVPDKLLVCSSEGENK